jgi:hypothetical protein
MFLIYALWLQDPRVVSDIAVWSATLQPLLSCLAISPQLHNGSKGEARAKVSEGKATAKDKGEGEGEGTGQSKSNACCSISSPAPAQWSNQHHQNNSRYHSQRISE